MMRQLEPATLFRTVRQAQSKIEQFYKQGRVWHLKGKPEWRRTSLGFQMQIDTSDPMDVDFYLGYYQQELLKLIRILVSTNDVVIDIGAQKGFISLVLSKQVGPDGSVVSIEPDARALNFLRGHARQNGCDNIITCGYGLGATTETCDFALSTQLGWSSRYPNEAARQCVTSITQIQVRTLDDVVQGLNGEASRRKITFIKMDAEGSEPDIINGSFQTLSQHKPALYMEVNKRSLAARGSQTDMGGELLRDLGYRFFWVQRLRVGTLGSSIRLQSLNCLTEGTEDLYDVLAIVADDSRRSGLARFTR